MASVSDTPQRISRLTPLTDVLARVDERVGPVRPCEVAVAAAAGRVLAGEVSVARRPRAPLALRDGWAVSAELTTDASPYAPAPLPSAIRIDVGEALPAGADAVAPLDIVAMRDDRSEIIAPVAIGDGVLPVGADASERTVLARGEQRLTRVQAAVLAAAGVTRLAVCEPRVRLVRARPGNDDAIEAALQFLAGAIAAAGGHVITALQGPASVPLEDALSDATADATIVVGGTGSGKRDASVHALAQVGRIEAHGIALTPGDTTAWGFVGSRPVLLLPGRLDAVLAVWLVIGRRLLARLAGETEEESASKARLVRKIASPPGLAEVVPVRLRADGAEPIASGYVPLSALARADGWILVPAESEGYPPGTEVMIRPLP